MNSNNLINVFKKNNKKTVKNTKPIKITYQDGDMLGYINIPSIKTTIPIYEGDDYATLQQGIGHIKNGKKKTTFPFLGKGQNCLLAGHSGLSTAKIFTNLKDVDVGDKFYIRAMKKCYEYRVVDKVIKKPDEAKKYIPYSSKKDYCTLITCTPVPMNTHRLLIIGERIKYDKKFNVNNIIEHQASVNYSMALYSSVFMFVLFLLSFVYRKRHLLLRKRGDI